MRYALLVTLALSTALLALGAPVAVADEVCVEAAACAGVARYSFGEGSCESTDFAYERTTYAYARVDQGPQHREVFVQNYCYRYDAWGYEEHGSGLHVGYREWNDETWDYGLVVVSWYGFEWPGGTYCGVSAASYDMQPIPDGRDEVDCPAGYYPPHLLP